MQYHPEPKHKANRRKIVIVYMQRAEFFFWWLARKFTPVDRARGADVPWRGSGCGLGAEHDVVAERVEAADEALGGAVFVDAVEVVGTEVSEGDGALQYVEGSDQDLVRDGHGRLLRPHARPQPVELVAQVAALGPGAADCGGDQGGLEVRVALAGAAPLLLARALVVGRAEAGPGGQRLDLRLLRRVQQALLAWLAPAW